MAPAQTITQGVAAEVEKARERFRAGDHRGAIDVLESAQKQFGPSASGAVLLSDIRFFASDYERALEAISDAIVLASHQASAPPAESVIRKCAILTSLGRREAAIELLGAVPVESRKAAFFRALRQAIATREEVTAFEKIATPNFFRKDASSLAALNHYAILLREKGDSRAGIVVARERFLKALSAFRFGRQAKPAVKPGWVEEATVCLADLRKEFDKAGIPFFLISGTFLGAFRDSNIIGHDKDIDVGVDEAVPIEKLVEVFSASPFFTIKDIPSKRSVYISHANGVSVDVFVHYMEGGKYWHEGPKVRWWNSPFDLTEISFLGGEYKVPADADRYLVENYGIWRTPVPEFETFVDTPNMEVTNRDHMIWYYLTKLTDYYMLGRKPQFARVWSALEAIYPADEALSEAARQVIDHATPASQQPAQTLVAQPWLPGWAIGPGRLAKRLGRAALRRAPARNA